MGESCAADDLTVDRLDRPAAAPVFGRGLAGATDVEASSSGRLEAGGAGVGGVGRGLLGGVRSVADTRCCCCTNLQWKKQFC